MQGVNLRMIKVIWLTVQVGMCLGVCVYMCTCVFVFQEEQEERSMALKDSCEKMKQEITQRHQEIQTLMEGIKASNTQLQKEQQELEDRKEMINSKEVVTFATESLHVTFSVTASGL